MTSELTVGELRDLIKDYPDECKLRFAYQANYPLQDTVEGVVSTVEMAENDGEDAEYDDKSIVYIVSGGQDYHHPYAPRRCWDHLS